jgi:hypothetical protein
LARTRLQHGLLLHYIPLYFPEFGRYWYSTRSEWFIRFLIRFPVPSAVRALSRDAFIAEAWDIVGKKWDKRAKLEEIYELARCSIGLPVALDSPAVETFRLQLERYAEINERRAWLDRRAQEVLANNSDFQLLIQLPGVAAITALMIWRRPATCADSVITASFSSTADWILPRASPANRAGRKPCPSAATSVSE